MVISSGSKDALGVRLVRDPGLLRPLIQFKFATVIMHDVSVVVYPSRRGLARVSIHLVDELSAGLIGTLGDERRA